MNFKKTALSIQNKNSRDIDNLKDYPTISDLMKEQKISNNKGNSVHYRRDLDALG